MYKKILVGLDSSDAAKHALERALKLKKQLDSEVVAFHSVVHHISELSPIFSWSEQSSGVISMQIHEDYINLGKKILKEAEDLFKKEDLNLETRLIFDITPENYIKKIVKDEKFDLVILGCEGQHNKLKRTFIGTIPEHAINEVPCDVLVIK